MQEGPTEPISYGTEISEYFLLTFKASNLKSLLVNAGSWEVKEEDSL